jgi:hypothetical protein
MRTGGGNSELIRRWLFSEEQRNQTYYFILKTQKTCYYCVARATIPSAFLYYKVKGLFDVEGGTHEGRSHS